jgi:cytochrome c peroxidase
MQRLWMKHVPVFLLGSALVACSAPAPNERPKVTMDAEAYAADQELLSLAQATFEPLPDSALSDSNPLTPEKVTLGKALFYDKRLSKKGTISCNSCHMLSGFGADAEATSTGDGGAKGTRNSPTVLNAAFHTSQFWDGRASDVEEQAGMPIMNPIEMGIPSKAFLESRLKEIPDYQDRFAAAFPKDKEPVTYYNLQLAIAAFERTLVTPSRFDAYLKGRTKAITAEEKKGLREFMGSGCITCHRGVGIGGAMFQKFGLQRDYREFTGSRTDDQGRKALTGQGSDEDVFKVPGLRNSVGTAPYFHDGSVASLDSSVMIMAEAQLNRKLSPEQVASIVAFLGSLSGEVPVDARAAPEALRQ